jgi:hypothetical protein
MSTITTKDGTRIFYEEFGSGETVRLEVPKPAGASMH